MNHIPSLFVFKTTKILDDGAEHVTCEMVVDLASVLLVAKRPIGGGYYINLGSASIPCPDEAGAAIRDAWIAFRGKFNPKTDR